MNERAAPARPLRLAVIGGGWAGLSAAVTAVETGHRVSLFEMARQWGGRARSTAGSDLDNGQHILIGAYRETLALMRRVGVDPEQVLLRRPLALRWADGRGLELANGPAAWAFTAAVMRCNAWSWGDGLRLLATCGRWAAAGFRCQPDRSVGALCAGLPADVRRLLIDPLCVAALNTPAREASAAIFLRVLRDGLFGGRGASDLLLPRRPLRELLPEPAARWLAAHGAELQPGRRVMALTGDGATWRVDGQPFDGVILACPAGEAARLVQPVDAGWSALAGRLRFEPIVTVYAHCAGVRLPLPMLALPEDAHAPAQYVFDHGALGGLPGRLAFVVSGAAPWVARGLDATAAAIQAQAARELGRWGWAAGAARVEDVIAERRATFRSTPGLVRPPMRIAPGLVAAGDHVAGPYPATLEGAVRAGARAVVALTSTMQNSALSDRRPP
ncbi:MAG: FAD-dependent oxidoreductase [Rubrivivax sp.]|nr:FAD-dependent oxidoreductase [Rubrivivax sp.]